ncbi:excisionase [Escherichia coli]|uniref:helix-turn-helix transcriptional regulator n=1 Tax=Escherichia coli TaxID=562 RepID=UPI0010A5BF7E|nr:excisionase [Escherichia coli]THK17073.1 excisionase [Escherichia coli]
MQHELQPDSLVDLKFIMADTGFGKTFIYDRIKSGDLPKAKVIHGRARWLLDWPPESPDNQYHLNK